MIKKSLNDNCEYRFITLDNNLKVLLISDSVTDVCACAMDVMLAILMILKTSLD